MPLRIEEGPREMGLVSNPLTICNNFHILKLILCFISKHEIRPIIFLYYINWKFLSDVFFIIFI